MNKISTIEQARALPEVDASIMFGMPIFGGGITGDSIILFVDADGRSMQVIKTKDGYAKCEWHG